MRSSATRTKDKFKTTQTSLARIKGRLKAYTSKFRFQKKKRSLKDFNQFMKLNQTIANIHDKDATKALLGYLRTNSARWPESKDYNSLLFNFTVPELSMQSKYNPLHLYDVRNSTYYCETIRADNFELYSFHSRVLIRSTNRELFSTIFNHYISSSPKHLDESCRGDDLSKKLIHEMEREHSILASSLPRPRKGAQTPTNYVFEIMFKKLLTELKNDPKEFREEKFEYMIYIIELGLIQREDTLVDILTLLDLHVKDVFSEFNDKVDSEDLESQSNMASSSSSSSVVSSSNEIDFEDDFNFDRTENSELLKDGQDPGQNLNTGRSDSSVVSSSDETNKRSASLIGADDFKNPFNAIYHSRVFLEKLRRLFDTNEPLKMISKLFSKIVKTQDPLKPAGEQIVKMANKAPENGETAHNGKHGPDFDEKRYNEHQLEENFTKLQKIVNLVFLVLATLNDLRIQDIHKAYKANPKILSKFAKKKIREKRPKFLFESERYLNKALRVVMSVIKILTFTNYHEEAGIELFLADEPKSRAVNQIFMTFLSVRNDPFLSSQSHTNAVDVELSLDYLQKFTKLGISRFQEQAKILDKLLKIMIFGSAENYRPQSRHYRNRRGIRYTDIDFNIIKKIKEAYIKVENQLEETTTLSTLTESQIQASLVGIPAVILSILHFTIEIKSKIQTSVDDYRLDELVDSSVAILTKILKGNYAGQTLFFNGKSDVLLWKAFDMCPLVFVPMLDEIFDGDYSLIFKSQKNGRSLFLAFVKLMTRNLAALEPVIGSGEFFKLEGVMGKRRVLMIELFVVNSFLSRVIKTNVVDSKNQQIVAELKEFLQLNIDEIFYRYFSKIQKVSGLLKSYEPVLRRHDCKSIRENLRGILRADDDFEREFTERESEGRVRRGRSNTPKHNKANRLEKDSVQLGRRRSRSKLSDMDVDDLGRPSKNEIIEAEMYLSFVTLFNIISEKWKHMTISIRMQKNTSREGHPGESFDDWRPKFFKIMGFTKIDINNLSQHSKSLESLSSKGGRVQESYKFHHDLKNSVPFITQLLRLYCNERVFEFDEDIVAMSQLDILERVQYETDHLFEIIKILNKSESFVDSSSRLFEDYKDFMLEGYLKIIYKFLKGVVYEVDRGHFDKTRISLLFEQLRYILKNKIEELLPATKIGESSIGREISELMGCYIKIEGKVIYKTDLRARIEAGGGGAVKRRKADQDKLRWLQRILKKIGEIYRIYKREDIICELRRETHSFLQRKPTRLFEKIDIRGSQALHKLYDRFKSHTFFGKTTGELERQMAEGLTQADVSLPKNGRNGVDVYEENDEEILGSQNNFQGPGNNLESRRQIGYGKVSQLPQDGAQNQTGNKIQGSSDKANQESKKGPKKSYNPENTLFNTILIREYIQVKEKYLFNPENNFNKFIEDGDNEYSEKDQFYRLFLKWVIELFASRFRINKTKFLHPDSEHTLILRDAELYSWVHILTNVIISKPQAREIFFDKFFLESSAIKMKCLEDDPLAETVSYDLMKEYREEELTKAAKRVLGILVQHTLQGDIHRDEKTKEITVDVKELNKSVETVDPCRALRKRRSILKSDIFVSLIFESAFYLQRFLRSGVFTRSFATSMEYYFSLLGFCKALAEDNFSEFKLFVGRLRKENIYRGNSLLDGGVEEKPHAHHSHGHDHHHHHHGRQKKNVENKVETINYLDCLYQGIHLHSKVSRRHKRLMRQDKPHLFWYNIATMSTLSEYFTGPCRYNQDYSIKDFSKILRFSMRINRDHSNFFYLVQDEAITLVQALIEGENLKKYSVINRHFKPSDFYNAVVKRLEIVCSHYLNQSKKRRKKFLRLSKKSRLQQQGGNRILNNSTNTNLINNNNSLANNQGPLAISNSKNQNEEGAVMPTQIDAKVQEGMKIDPWKLPRKIIQRYLTAEDFKDHPVLKTSIGLYSVMMIIATRSNPVYSKFISKKKVDVATQIGHSKALNLNQNETVIVEKKNNRGENNGSQLFYQLLKEPVSMILDSKMNVDLNRGAKPGEPVHEDDLDKSKLRYLSYFYFLNWITGTVEIMNSNREPITVYFQILPECLFLSKENKQEFLNNCNYDDVTARLGDLMGSIPRLREVLKSSQSLYRNLGSFSGYLTDGSFNLMMRRTWFVSLILNIIVLLGYEWVDPEGSEGFVDGASKFEIKTPYSTLVLIAGVVIISLSIVNLIIWFIAKYPLQIRLGSQILEESKEGRNFVSTFKKYIWYSLIMQAIPMDFIIHILFTVSGLVFDSPLLLSMNLHCFFFLSKTAQYIARALINHMDQVMVTILVGVLFIYSFTIVNASDYRMGWDPFTAGDLDMCKSMLSCFGYVLDFGFRNGGGIAESHDTVEFEGVSGGYNYWYKVGFNLLFFILIAKFVLDIIFGIIVDSFSDMRQDQEKRSKFLDYRL